MKINKTLIVLGTIALLILLRLLTLPSKDKVNEINLKHSIDSAGKKIEVTSYKVVNGNIVSKKVSLNPESENEITKKLIMMVMDGSKEDLTVKLDEIYFSENSAYIVFDSEIKSNKTREAIGRIIADRYDIADVKFLVVK